ncbi:hypothetical protein, partial [Escherichia coli]|uniref:hypothetical protein n=1 Tax=Escherichia coli TaxID=562 RepID=UPI001A7E054B
RHHIQQEHRIAASGMVCRLYDTFRQGKPGTTFTEIKIFNQKSAGNAPSAHLQLSTSFSLLLIQPNR